MLIYHHIIFWMKLWFAFNKVNFIYSQNLWFEQIQKLWISITKKLFEAFVFWVIKFYYKIMQFFMKIIFWKIIIFKFSKNKHSNLIYYSLLLLKYISNLWNTNNILYEFFNFSRISLFSEWFKFQIHQQTKVQKKIVCFRFSVKIFFHNVR